MPNPHEGHRERLKNMFRQNGLDNMEPHQVLELLLTFAIPRRDVNETAHALINEFDGFDRVLEADIEQLKAVKGVGENAATLIKLVLESYRYYEKAKSREALSLASVGAAMDYARSLFVGETREQGYLLCFDANLKLTKCARLSQGTVNAAAVSVRRVVEIATANKAVSVILTHNHPGGLATPSREDLATTKKIMQALHLVGITLTDHVVVGETFALSMAEGGVLHNMREELGI